MGKAPRPRYCRRCPGRLLLAECAHSKNGGPPLIDENPSNDIAATPPAVDAPTSILMIEPVVATAIPAAQGLASLGPSSLGLVDDSQIDPTLLEISKRIRVTAKNPVHGYVEGCSRGTQPYSVRRPISLRPAIMESGKATKRYYREVNNIIAQCERLGKETGCLILLNAQHLNATGPGLTFSLRRQMDI
ncbi:hypothetical protein BDN72DRAFT_901303 [Pluteus cervinus]|uniref:Uncharacterized protein n=1 Tax=Pluteus cervinus TaxID=181527 RepID=A0ACD3AHH1_9AGAR|nr:hypothetical protein BDN72DRAFT_901303 [Pluteus cervinus]